MKPFRSIRARLIFYFSLVFVTVFSFVELTSLVGLPFAPYSGRRGQQREDTFRAFSLIADMKKDRLLRWIKERHGDASVFTENNLIKQQISHICAIIGEFDTARISEPELLAAFRNEESYNIIEEYLKNMQTAYGVYKRIHVVDAENGIIIVSTDGTCLGDNITDRNYYTMALQSDGFHLNDIEIERKSSSPLLIISDVFRDKSGKIMAILLMEVDAEKMINPILHTGDGLGQTGEALLVNQDTRILTSLKHSLPDGAKAKPLEYQIEARPAAMAANGKEGIVESEDYRGERVLAAYRHIRLNPEVGWGMVVKQDASELFAPLQRETIYSFAIGLSGIFVVVGLTILITRSITGPILSLSRASKMVSEGDLDTAVSIASTDEIGHLAGSFNTMLQRIKDRTNDLNLANQQLQRQIEQRIKAEEELEQLLYAASHDLRSPLVNIDGFSGELEQTCKELSSILENSDVPSDVRRNVFTILREEIPEILQYILTSSAKMDLLLSGLLRLSRLRHTTLNIKRISMDRLMSNVVSTLEFRIKESDILVKIEKLPPCFGDETQINQVFSNLIENAIKFLDPTRPGVIRISGLEAEGESIYCIEDNGIGISEKNMDVIFQVFYRENPNSGEGEGLGLTTARRILSRHGGRIWLESTTGIGSKFFVSLPNRNLPGKQL